MHHVITIEPSGAVKYLEKHTESLDLGKLGAKSIKRATDIIFEEATQKWDVVLCGHERDPHPPASMGFATYELARQFEVEWLQKSALLRVDPLSDEGKVIAIYARSEVDEQV